MNSYNIHVRNMTVWTVAVDIRITVRRVSVLYGLKNRTPHEGASHTVSIPKNQRYIPGDIYYNYYTERRTIKTKYRFCTEHLSVKVRPTTTGARGTRAFTYSDTFNTYTIGFFYIYHNTEIGIFFFYYYICVYKLL